MSESGGESRSGRSWREFEPGEDSAVLRPAPGTRTVSPVGPVLLGRCVAC